MSGLGQWCALCVAYGDHDTGHHDAKGGVAVGDFVEITKGEYQGKQGVIDRHRGFDVTVRIKGGRGNTLSPTVPVADVKRI